MTKYIIILTVVSWQTTYAQLKDIPFVFNQEPGVARTVSKDNFDSIISKSIAQPYKDQIILLSKSWQTCNDDNSFFLKDTVYFCTNDNYYSYNDKQCCKHIYWTFFEQNQFIEFEHDSQCKAYDTLMNVQVEKRKLDIVQKDGELSLQIRKDDMILYKFEVISIRQVTNNFGGAFEIIKLIKKD